MREVVLALIEVPVDPDEDAPEVWLTDGRIPELEGLRLIWSRRERTMDPPFVMEDAADG